MRLLGPTEVLRYGQAVDLPGGRARSLLVLLALQVGGVISSDTLVDDLWGERPPSSAKTLLHGFVSRLRTVLEPDRDKGSTGSILETVGAGYRLTTDPETVDVNRFRRLLDEARSLSVKQRVSTLETALKLWRGPALADFAYEPFAQRAITSLDELRVGASEDLVDGKLELGRHGEVIPALEELISAHPYRERLRGQLMLALYREGRQADALEVFEKTRRVLLEELGIDPGHALRDLEERILVQDPGLDVRVSTGPMEDARSRPGTSWLFRERRTVTALFVDIAPIVVDPDPEADRSVIADKLDTAFEAIRAHGGRIEDSVGDVVVGFFGLPVAHEDDPLRALWAALDAREAVLGESNESLGFRAAVETGEVVSGSPDGTKQHPSGPPITIAARLQQAARRGDVLIGPTAMRLVQGSAVVTPVRDLDLAAWRLLAVDPDATLLPRHFDAPTVGRVQELSRLRTTFSRTARADTAFRLTVIGEAGIGKTRLSRDFTHSVSDRALIATAKCLPDRQGGTFQPLHDLLVQVAGVSGWSDLAAVLEQNEDGTRFRNQVAGAFGLGPVVGSPQELFVATKRAFELVTRHEPLAAVIDDVHWAEETFLDLVEYLTENLEAPVLFLCLARPEVLEQRPGWSTRTARSDILYLEPLGSEDVNDIVRERAGVDLVPDTIRKITKAAQGNPLFAEQMLTAFQSDETDAIPASLRSLLATRIDRLGPGERDLLRCAAVAGDHLTEEALEALVPDRARPYLTRHLTTLETRRLLHRSKAATLRFGHGLIRDAAYQSLTLTDRARLHLRFAEWLEADGAAQPVDLDIVAGFHLEQAVLCRQQEGGDDTQDGLASRAGERLTDAGTRAFANLDLPAAANLLARARALLLPDHPQRSSTTQLLAEVSLPLGDHAQAQELLLEISESPDIDPATRWSARVERARSLCLTGPDPVTHEEISDLARKAFDFFERAEDDKGRAQATFLQGQLHQLAGRPVDVVSLGRRSVGYADSGNAQRERLASRYLVVEGLIEGPDPVERCLVEAESLSLIDGVEHPIVMLGLARLHTMLGQFDDASALVERARRILVERFRIRRLQMFVSLSRAVVDVLANDLRAAERAYQAALLQAREGGERSMIAVIAARLALLFATQDRMQEAAALASESRTVAPAENTSAQALSLAAMARTLPRHKLDEAVNAMADAVERVPVEMSTLRADLLVERARLAKASGHESDARKHADLALDLYERKQYLAAAHNLRQE
jgi:DNA-binding SARP family transcriptional activator/tetratricopeptide (TPR) repeat protein